MINDTTDPQPPASFARRYYIELGSAMAAYGVVLIASVSLLQRHPDPHWVAPIAIAPAIPACFALLAILRHLQRLDELHQRIMLDACAFAAGSVAIITFAYGFLEDNAGYPHVSLIFVLPLTALMFGLAAALAARRYA